MNKEKFVQKNYNYSVRHTAGTAPIKMWDAKVTIEEAALKQLDQVAAMPFVKPWVAAMPDTHWGMGATVGSVIPTVGAIMPAAVGVDIGCGMMAIRTNLKAASAFPDMQKSLMFDYISKAVPHGRTNNGGPGDIGAWPEALIPGNVLSVWNKMLREPVLGLELDHPGAVSKNAVVHLGTLGTGNHFIEVCTEIDNPESNLWIVIHSGSRGFGNRIGTYFTKLAGDLCKKWFVNLPNKDLGFFPVGTKEYDDYLGAVLLAQNYAWFNRELMMQAVLKALGADVDPVVDGDVPAMVHMHHNYAAVTKIGNETTILTRKGAVDASRDKWVIIPGSMGAKTYIGKGLGNKDSFNSCSHGAGRAMSRGEALKTFSVEDHEKATAGVYCDKTQGVLDETPGAYKDIDAVMESQKDLVEPVIKIKQLVCVKGLSD